MSSGVYLENCGVGYGVFPLILDLFLSILYFYHRDEFIWGFEPGTPLNMPKHVLTYVVYLENSPTQPSIFCS